MLYQLIYISESAGKIERTVVQDILSVAQANNAALGITGVLMATDRHFMQLLEGSKEAVLALCERIEMDERHQNLRVLLEQPVSERAFPDWSMAIVEQTPTDIKRLLRENENREFTEVADTIAHSQLWIADFINECQRQAFDRLRPC